jgi:hypothetical protein
MQIQQKSYCTFLLKFKSCDVAVNPSSVQKETVAVCSLPESPYLKYETDEGYMLVNAAGEYESRDIFFTGKKVTEEPGIVYSISGEEITVGVISFINSQESVPVELFENVDILILGAGGGMNMPPKQAHDLIQKISPKVCFIHGLDEQASKDVKGTLLPLDEVKTDITGLLVSPEKSYKTTKEELDRIENTEVYYFEL